MHRLCVWLFIYNSYSCCPWRGGLIRTKSQSNVFSFLRQIQKKPRHPFISKSSSPSPNPLSLSKVTFACAFSQDPHLPPPIAVLESYCLQKQIKRALVKLLAKRSNSVLLLIYRSHLLPTFIQPNNKTSRYYKGLKLYTRC